MLDLTSTSCGFAALEPQLHCVYNSAALWVCVLALGFSLLVRFASFRVSYRMIIAFAIGGRSSATVGLFTYLSRVLRPWRAPHNEVERRPPMCPPDVINDFNRDLFIIEVLCWVLAFCSMCLRTRFREKQRGTRPSAPGVQSFQSCSRASAACRRESCATDRAAHRGTARSVESAPH